MARSLLLLCVAASALVFPRPGRPAAPPRASAGGGGDGDVVQRALLSRRTVHTFDNARPVPQRILRRAVACAIRAPNHRLTEPWRFVSLGPEAVAAIAALNAASIGDPARAAAKAARWAEIRHWLLVTAAVTPGDAVRTREDYAAACCAVRNLQLALAADGVGAKWTSGAVQRTPDFARICGVDADAETVVGVVWYGFPADEPAKPTRRKRGVDDVLSRVP